MKNLKTINSTGIKNSLSFLHDTATYFSLSHSLFILELHFTRSAANTKENKHRTEHGKTSTKLDYYTAFKIRSYLPFKIQRIADQHVWHYISSLPSISPPILLHSFKFFQMKLEHDVNSRLGAGGKKVLLQLTGCVRWEGVKILLRVAMLDAIAAPDISVRYKPTEQVHQSKVSACTIFFFF